jgi:hypothetical protein
MPTSTRAILTAAALLVGVSSTNLNAQRPSSWVFHAQGGLTSGAVQALGKIAWVQQGASIAVFSAKTRRWISHPVAPGATIRQTNDWLVVETPIQIDAFSATTGRFESIPVGVNHAIVNPTAQRNDVVLAVRDGNTLWCFSGLRGGWRSSGLGSGAGLSVLRNALIAVDGTNLIGYSALTGTFRNATANGAPSAVAIGDGFGLAIDGSTVHAYSAITDRWTSELFTAAPSVASLVGDVAILTTAIELAGYSGVHGTIERQFVPTAGMAFAASDHIAHASADGLSHWFFGAGSGRFTQVTTSTVATVLVDGAVGALVENQTVHGYSALTGIAVSQNLANASVDLVVSQVAALDGNATRAHIFSAFTGTWTPAPPTALAGMPELARNVAVLGDQNPSRWWFFSPRHARYIPFDAGPNSSPIISRNNALGTIEDDQSVAQFDPRRDAILTTPIGAGDRPLNLRTHRMTYVAHAPASDEVIGFASLHGAVERAPAIGTVFEVRANSEVGLVLTDQGIHAFATSGDLGSEMQFPEFRRMPGRGSELHLRLDGPSLAGHAILAGFASSSSTPVAGLGDLDLDPTQIVAFPALALDAGGQGEVVLATPNNATLAGLDLGFQAVVLPAAGAPYLSRLTTIYLP